MDKFVFIGEVGAGKTTLLNALEGDFSLARKTQAVEFSDGGGVDTPGEYFSHPRFYSALINTLSDCHTLIYVHSANNFECRIPSGLFDIYPSARCFAVITKKDAKDANVDLVKNLLKQHGFVEPIFVVNALNSKDLQPLKKQLTFFKFDNRGFYEKASNS